MTRKFLEAKKRLSVLISKSKSPEDPSHAENTMSWIKQLKPDADEILLLAGFGHDVERSLPDRYKSEMFNDYDRYKRAHAERASKIAAGIAMKVGFSKNETDRLQHIISDGEFRSNDSDAQILNDADSISFFDNNVSYYLSQKGKVLTEKKMALNYERASERAKKHIQKIMMQKPGLDLISLSK